MSLLALVDRSTNTMTDLSPAAQAVMDAAKTGLDGYIELLPPTWKSSIAAALRAAADQVVPEESPPGGGMRPGGTGALTLDEAQGFQRAATRRRILAIAAELEAQ